MNSYKKIQLIESEGKNSFDLASNENLIVLNLSEKPIPEPDELKIRNIIISEKIAVSLMKGDVENGICWIHESSKLCNQVTNRKAEIESELLVRDNELTATISKLKQVRRVKKEIQISDENFIQLLPLLVERIRKNEISETDYQSAKNKLRLIVDKCRFSSGKINFSKLSLILHKDSKTVKNYCLKFGMAPKLHLRV